MPDRDPYGAYNAAYAQSSSPRCSMRSRRRAFRSFGMPPCPTRNIEQLWVPFRPACRVWRVSRSQQREITQWLLSDNPARPAWDRFYTASGWRGRVVSVRTCMAHVWPNASHRACVQWHLWHLEVLLALMHHGHYDPATHHTPPPAQQLEAVELGGIRNAWDACFPELPGLFWPPEAHEEGDTHA